MMSKIRGKNYRPFAHKTFLFIDPAISMVLHWNAQKNQRYKSSFSWKFVVKNEKKWYENAMQFTMFFASCPHVPWQEVSQPVWIDYTHIFNLQAILFSDQWSISHFVVKFTECDVKVTLLKWERLRNNLKIFAPNLQKDIWKLQYWHAAEGSRLPLLDPVGYLKLGFKTSTYTPRLLWYSVRLKNNFL